MGITRQQYVQHVQEETTVLRWLVGFAACSKKSLLRTSLIKITESLLRSAHIAYKIRRRRALSLHLLHPVNNILPILLILISILLPLKPRDNLPHQPPLLLIPVHLPFLHIRRVLMSPQPIRELIIQLLHRLVQDLLVRELRHHRHEHLVEILLAACAATRLKLLHHLRQQIFFAATTACRSGSRSRSRCCRVPGGLHPFHRPPDRVVEVPSPRTASTGSGF